MLSILIVMMWYETGFPGHEYGRQIYVGITVGLGLLVLVRGIRWPGFLGLIFLTWFLANSWWPRS